MSVVAVLGAHWGDEGKGKVAAALSRDAHYCARFQGGPNAGHTVLLPGRTEPFTLRLIPSGTLTGAVGVIGGGCVIEPRILLDEIAAVSSVQSDLHDRLVISTRAHVITPDHIRLDQAGSGVGSTRMGVGPAYRDKMGRTGMRVSDLLRPTGGDAATQALAAEFADTLAAVCTDERDVLRAGLDRGARVVAEGAQGSRLDIDHGDYPYVTSSNPTIGGVLTGLGLGPRDIGRVLLVSPAYVSKVGGGDLPSRVPPDRNRELQSRGEELDGATGLMRDTGWLDVGWLRRAARLNQADGVIVTKVDVLAGTGAVGLFDDTADPPVAFSPGWSADDVIAGTADDPLEAFLRTVERTGGRPVVAVSRGKGLDDWSWRDEQSRERLWARP